MRDRIKFFWYAGKLLGCAGDIMANMVVRLISKGISTLA